MATEAYCVKCRAKKVMKDEKAVTMKNGTTFDTRYQPEEASWDPDKVVVMTEFGNRVALPAAEIESVAVDSESRGFGHQLNSTTMALGWAPNDALDLNSEEGKAALAADAAAQAAAANAPQVYNQQQFVEPEPFNTLAVHVSPPCSVRRRSLFSRAPPGEFRPRARQG